MLIERFAVAVAALTLTLAPASALAQKDATWIAPVPNEPASLYNIEWPGGRLNDFLDGLDGVTPHSFIYPAGASYIELQPFTVTKTFPNEALRVVQGLTRGFSFSAEGGDIAVGDPETNGVREIERPWAYVVSLSSDAIAEAKAERSRFDLSFPGGTVAQYVAALQKAAGEQKIVLMPEAAAQNISSVSLTNITLGEAAMLLEEIAEVNVGNISGVMLIKPRTAGFRGGDSSVELDSSVWSTEEIIGANLTAEQLLSAIDTAVELEGGTASVRFHRETGLLMAKGSAGELHVIDAVLTRAKHTANVRGQNQIDYAGLIEKTEFAIEKYRIDRDLMHGQLDYLVQQLEDIEKMAQKQFASETEVKEARMAVRNAEADFRKAELLLEEASKQLEAYTRKAKEQAAGRSGRTTS